MNREERRNLADILRGGVRCRTLKNTIDSPEVEVAETTPKTFHE
jgi:hypothetical protein